MQGQGWEMAPRGVKKQAQTMPDIQNKGEGPDGRSAAKKKAQKNEQQSTTAKANRAHRSSNREERQAQQGNITANEKRKETNEQAGGRHDWRK
jgi:hypothetical protein